MLLGAIDRVEVVVPREIPLSRSLLRGSLPPSHRRMAAKQRYEGAHDLRGVGIDAILYLNSSHTGQHKLQVIDSGEKYYSQIIGVLEAVFDTAADSLKISRLDLCVDVNGLSVEWFFKHVRVAFKRHMGRFGIKYSLSQQKFETLYFGARPNRLVIYDKIGELAYQCKLMARRHKRLERQTVTFEEFSGLPRSGITLTRIERQWSGSRIPVEAATLANLKCSAANFNPFGLLKFLNTDIEAPVPTEGICAAEYLKFKGFRQTLREKGAHGTKKLLNALSPGNGSRLYHKLASKQPPSSVGCSPNLFDLYQRSLERQLAR